TLSIAAARVIAVAASSQSTATAQTRTTEAPKAAGIEPDEIDARQRAKADAAAHPAPASPPARARPAATTPAASAGKVMGPSPSGPQKYETAECGTPEKPITCCTQGVGPAASCNLFILLCNEGGGTGKGDGGDAICVN
ncbi:MAG: hypothetical protein LH491_02965, partial [Pseudoxanthomonas sp.]|nr:hypothetical protein [Pseudoxanthomonas sp.]